MKFNTDSLIALIVGALVMLGVFGWIHNIFLIVEAETVTGLVLLRCFGIIFAPLGAVLGYV